MRTTSLESMWNLKCNTSGNRGSAESLHFRIPVMILVVLKLVSFLVLVYKDFILTGHPLCNIYQEAHTIEMWGIGGCGLWPTQLVQVANLTATPSARKIKDKKCAPDFSDASVVSVFRIYRLRCDRFLILYIYIILIHIAKSVRIAIQRKFR